MGSDMWAQQDIFNQAIAHFSSEQEEIRTAAAFAAGKFYFFGIPNRLDNS